MKTFKALWLDDVRQMPTAYDVHVKTASEAIAELETGNYARVSLDHDLGDEKNGTGYDVAVWIEKQAHAGELDRLEISVHSANPVGVSKMMAAINSAKRAWRRNPL